MSIPQYLVHEDDLGELYSQAVGAFEEVALLTTAESVPLDDVLRLVGRRLCELLNVTRCSVYLRREDGLFQGQVGYCVGANIDKQVRRLVAGVKDDQFTAEIVGSSAPVLIHEASKDPRTLRRTMQRWGVRDMLGVPLVVDGDVIGIIYVDSQEKSHSYTSRDMMLARAFAGLSALAVRQAWLYQQLRERTQTIDQQRRVLSLSREVHNRVMRAVLDGADIDGILQLIADLLGKPISLYGPKLEIRSWAAPTNRPAATPIPLTPKQISEPWVRRAIAQLHSGSLSILLKATPELRHRRLLVRLLVDHRCVGYLEACERGRPFSEVDAKALEQAALAAALNIASTQRNAEIRRQEAEDYIADVLYGRRDPQMLAARGAAFGVDATKGHVLLRVHYEHEAPDTSATGIQRRQAIAAVLSSCTPDGGRCVGMIGVPGADLFVFEVPGIGAGAFIDELGAALKGISDRLRDEFCSQFALISDICPSLQDVPTSAERVREVANLLHQSRRSPSVVFTRDLELLRMATGGEGLEGATRRGEELLSALDEYDSSTGSSLLETLEAYVRCDAQVRTTANELGVHENTVRYRLGKIRDVSTIAPDRLNSLLTVSVALQLRRLFGSIATDSSADESLDLSKVATETLRG